MNKMVFKIIVLVAIAAVSNAAGLIGHWPFDGNSNDTSGNGNDGIVHGSPGYVDGKMGQALELDGLVDGIELPNEAAFHTLNDADGTTISFWFKIPEGEVSNGAIICKYLFNVTYPEGEGWGFVIYTDDWAANSSGGIDGNISYVGRYNNNNVDTCPPKITEAYNDGKWHQLIAVFKSDNNPFPQYGFDWVSFYIDGVPQGAYGGTFLKAPFINTEPVTIGYISSYQSGKHWKGLIDDVRIYDYALSDAERDTLFRSSGGTICTSEIAGDLDSNCQVNMTDFALFGKDWLECSNFYPEDCFQ